MPGAFQDGDQVFVELGIKSPNGSSRNLQVMTNHITDFQLKQYKGGATEAHIKLYDETFDSLEDVIFNSGVLDNNPQRMGTSGQPVFYTSFGWARGVKSPTWELVVHKYNSSYALGKGTELELNCTGGLIQGIFQRRTRQYPVHSSVAQIVGDIARDNGLLVSVQDGTTRVSVFQRGMNDLRWLQVMATNGVFIAGSGDNNYSVWVDNTTTPATLYCRPGAAPSPESTEWTYLYGRDQEGQVKDWEVAIESASLFTLGASGYRAAIVNRGDKAVQNLITNSRSVQGSAGEGLVVPEQGNTPAPLRLAFEDRFHAIAYAADKFTRLNSTNVQGRLTVLGNPAIKPSDFVSVIVATGAAGISDVRDVHPTSGRYEIVSIEHNITLGDYTTTLELVRRGNLQAGVGGSVQTTGTPAAQRSIRAAEQALREGNGASIAKRQGSALQVFGGVSQDIIEQFAVPLLDRIGINVIQETE